MFERFAAVGVTPYISAGSRVLDYGCGPEPVLAGLLKKKGYAVDTYDLFFHPSESFQFKTYNLITLTEVLEHLPNPLEVLEALKWKLAPQGFIALMTLFHPNDSEKFSKWWYRRDATHVSFYTVKTIQRLAEILEMKVLFTDGERTAVLSA